MTERSIVVVSFTREEFASLDRMAETSGCQRRHIFIEKLIREIIADEQADRAGEAAVTAE